MESQGRLVPNDNLTQFWEVSNYFWYLQSHIHNWPECKKEAYIQLFGGHLSLSLEMVTDDVWIVLN